MDKQENKNTSPTLEELNINQRKAVVCKDKHVLILAGAGSGKTKTLIQKVAYLIAEKNIDPSKILAITFTKNAANEMLDRLIIISDKSGHYEKIIHDKKIMWREKENKRRVYIKKYPWLNNLTVKTFHSLCYRMLRSHGAKEFDNKFRILSEKNSGDNFLNTFRAPETPSQIVNKIIKSICSDQDYLMKLKRYIIDFYIDDYRVEMNNKGHPNYSKPYTTLAGDNVRSKSERMIADWLYQHKIKYEYEPSVQFKDFEFKPDFYIPQADAYLEHVSNLSYYMKDKEEQFKIANKTLIKTFEPMTTDIRKFYKVLDKNIIPLIKDDIEKEVALDVESEFSGYHKELQFFVFDLLSVINKIKVEDKNLKFILNKALNDQHDRVKIFYELAEPLIVEYKEYCIKRSYLDFNDIVIRAISMIKNNKDIKSLYKNKFQYILVDEFQDVNSLQVKLIKQLMNTKNQLFCVGDDWQSIYGFRGSEVEYIVNFKKYFKNPKIIKLKVNYRSNDTIVKASNELIKHNKFMIKKEIDAIQKEGRKIYLYCAQNEELDGVEKVIENVKKLQSQGYTKDDILILYRRTKSYEPYKYKLQGLVTARTIHSSKGLEARVVFIVGLSGGTYGFPYVRDADRIFQIIKESNYEFLMEEERRLFYVAITRAKEELFLISEVGNESQFIKELPGEFVDRENFLILNIKNKKNITCKGCGDEISQEFTYCPFCGKKVLEEVELTFSNEKKVSEKIETNSSKRKKESLFDENGMLKNLGGMKPKENAIAIEKFQVNRNNPAIAHLIITFPKGYNGQKTIKEIYDKYSGERFPSVNHSFKKISNEEYRYIIDHGSKFMYSWMEYMIESLEKEIKDYSVHVRGAWDKYDN